MIGEKRDCNLEVWFLLSPTTDYVTCLRICLNNIIIRLNDHYHYQQSTVDGGRVLGICLPDHLLLLFTCRLFVGLANMLRINWQEVNLHYHKY